MEIKRVTLQTANIKVLKYFYTKTLGLQLINENENSFCIAVGTSQLEFTERNVEGEPYYHFAFNIQANKFNEAKSWIKEKGINLNKEDGEDEADFSHLPAHSLYFDDPAGNIVEFISRHSISENGEESFSPKGILNISEISLTVNDAVTAGKQLIDIGIKERDNYPISATSLNFMGKRSIGIFILLTEPGRRWIFSDKYSAVYPLDITLSNNERISIDNKSELLISQDN
ncbi:VOC family protein [Virgibacillus sp. C22-A2]|uniref:VOC family protein n=1 Tax=Virgibacillus tibetensis TaxID=3042313 RepID=A0ABU6KHG6_9BACI|nr:VOC family protein [Virgibacillus sp. C22-A2]